MPPSNPIARRIAHGAGNPSHRTGSRSRGAVAAVLATVLATLLASTSCAATTPASEPPSVGADASGSSLEPANAAPSNVAARPARSADTLSTVQVSGTAEVDVEVDEVRVTFAVETEAATAEAATRANAERMEAVLAALRGTEVEGLQLETRGYSLLPQYGRTNTGRIREIEGYRAVNSVEATAPDVGATGSLIDAAVAGGANRVSSLAFRASDPEEARLRALGEAVGRARRKAEAIAEAMGLTLGSALEVTGGADSIEPVRMMRMDAMEVTGTPVEPGQQTVSASVTIRYVLRQPEP